MGLIVLLATLIVAPAAVAVDVPLPGVPETVGAGAPPETVANATPVGGRVLGVRELHISLLVNKKQEYRVRGLTLEPTQVQRFP